MIRRCRQASLVMALVLLAVPAAAQIRGRDPHPRGGRPKGPPRSSAINFVGVREAFEARRVNGVPYQATAVTEFVQSLGDGNRIVRRTTGAVARDSEGRTRRDHTIAAIGPMVPWEAPRMVLIQDPVADVSYMLDPGRQRARKMPLRRPEGERVGLATAPGFFELPLGRGRDDEVAPTPATASLGRQTIEGVEAEGTRYTVTIPPDSIGNEKPIQIVSERWYSPELQVVVLSRHQDPRFGETTYRLTEINRGEPERALFEVPANYTLEEGPPDHPFGFGRMRKRPYEDEEGSC